ncbi:MAG: ribosome-binding factor A [bacterium]|nr:ribosome-binding factor A [bacterium]
MGRVRNEKVAELLKHLAAEFLQSESNRRSLITVTGIRLKDDLSKAAILVTVYPAEKEEAALDFIKRRVSDLKDYVKKHSRLGRVPLLSFEIDAGEKNRQKIDELSHEK